MDLKLEGLRVIVTAGASGIGLAIARAFHEEGAKVRVCDIDRAALGALTEIKGAKCNVAKRDQVEKFINRSVEKLGGLDCLVNNAGIAGPTGLVEDIDPDDWDRCIKVCLTGQFNCARIAMPHLRKSANGSMINISSLAGRVGFAQRSAYAAAKWGVIGFTKSLAIEAGDDGVRVNAILPGIIEGERQKQVLAAKAEARGISFEDVEKDAFSRTSLKSYVQAEEIADQALYLASVRGRSISGQAISVCGDTQSLA